MKITKSSEEDFEQILNLISSDYTQNPYIYIDLNTYGFNNDNYETFFIKENQIIKVIIYRYYNTLQLFLNLNTSVTKNNIDPIIEYINDNNFTMISGCESLLNLIYSHVSSKYNISYGNILYKDSVSDEKIENVFIAKDYDYKDIVDLVCSDSEFGKYYKKSDLYEQFLDRKSDFGCKNAIIKEDNKIISHMGTYAELDNIAILSGLITSKDYLNKGYGKKVVTYLSDFVLKENKTPILYCYSNSLLKWYNNIGWKEKIKIVKLTIR